MLYITLSVCCSVAFRQFGLICHARLVCHTIGCRAFTAVVIIEPPIIFLLKELEENLKKIALTVLFTVISKWLRYKTRTMNISLTVMVFWHIKSRPPYLSVSGLGDIAQDWTVQCSKNFMYSSTFWIRFSRTHLTINEWGWVSYDELLFIQNISPIVIG